MKYFDVPMDHAGFTRTFKNKSNDQCRLFVHNFAYFSLFFWKPVFSKIYLNKKLQWHLLMYFYFFVCE